MLVEGLEAKHAFNLQRNGRSGRARHEGAEQASWSAQPPQRIAKQRWQYQPPVVEIRMIEGIVGLRAERECEALFNADVLIRAMSTSKKCGP